MWFSYDWLSLRSARLPRSRCVCSGWEVSSRETTQASVGRFQTWGPERQRGQCWLRRPEGPQEVPAKLDFDGGWRWECFRGGRGEAEVWSTGQPHRSQNSLSGIEGIQGDGQKRRTEPFSWKKNLINKRLWVERLFPRQGALNEGSGALSCRGAGGFVWSCALQDLPH